jgi:hypothetical protein
LARQKKLGVVPADTKLTARPKEIPAWDDMSAQQKQLFERQMETFAGFAEHTDAEVGRLVAQLEKIGALENTLFFYIVGDNGSSAEGGPEGTYNEMMALNGIVGKAEQMMSHIDSWGDPTTFPHFAIGWAWAGNTPFQWTKQVASHFGGTRNGMVLHWRRGSKPEAKSAASFTISSTWRRPRSKRRRFPNPSRSTALRSAPWTESQCSTRPTMPGRPIAAPRSISRCSVTAAFITRGGSPARGIRSPGSWPPIPR